MIQRKQSLWLLLAALCSAGVLYFDLYRSSGMPVVSLRTSDHYPSLLVALVMSLLPLISIFMFKDRKRQKVMTFVSMLATLSFISLILMRVSGLSKMTPPPAPGSYWIGAVLPAISLVLLILALVGINKDDKLVKSMDRLR